MRKTLFDIINNLSFSLEDDSSGIASTETEYVFYAKLTNKSVLENAVSIEDQEQWAIKVPKSKDNVAGGLIRIRKTTIENKTEYVFTIKTIIEAPQDAITKNNTNTPKASQNMREVGLMACEDAFEMFKLFCPDGMVKRRYKIPVEGTDMFFEVDSFLLPNGEYSDWVKIDLEVKNNVVDIPKLPEGFSEVIYNQKDKQTQEEKDLVWRLYENVFITKNKQMP